MCPGCSGPVALDFVACPACGRRLSGACPGCGRSLQAGWTFCPYCARGTEARSERRLRERTRAARAAAGQRHQRHRIQEGHALRKLTVAVELTVDSWLVAPVKTHYEMLGLEPTADADAIKKAFRREIARYHPDKVIHLGAEFQEMAATRAAELTVAYKTLTDPAMRGQSTTRASRRACRRRTCRPPPPRPCPIEADAAAGQAADDRRDQTPRRRAATRAGLQSERADRDVILRRAIAARVRATVEALYGKVETPTVRGFDLAMVPVAKPRFPRLAAAARAGARSSSAGRQRRRSPRRGTPPSRARVHAGKSPVVVLLFRGTSRRPARAVEGVGRRRAPTQGARRARRAHGDGRGRRRLVVPAAVEPVGRRPEAGRPDLCREPALRRSPSAAYGQSRNAVGSGHGADRNPGPVEDLRHGR